MNLHRTALIAATCVITLSSLSATTALAKKHQVSNVSKVRVTGRRVYGHTTKYATVKLVSTKNESLGHSKANKKGNFTIKTKKDLRKASFKFKVSRKGYVSRTNKFTPHKQKKITTSVASKTPVNRPTRAQLTNAKAAVYRAQDSLDKLNSQLTYVKQRMSAFERMTPADQSHVQLLLEKRDALKPGTDAYGMADNEYKYQLEGLNEDKQNLINATAEYNSLLTQITAAQSQLTAAQGNLKKL